MENIEIVKYATVLSNDPIAVENWKKIYYALKLAPAEVETLAQRKIIGLLKNFEPFVHILEHWNSYAGIEATVQRLEVVLRDLDLRTAADKVSGRAGPSALFQSVGPLKFPIRHNCPSLIWKYLSRKHLEEQIIAGLLNVTDNNAPINFPVVILHGFCGTGKSMLATKISQQTDLLENCIWISAEIEKHILSDFAKLFFTNNKSKENIHSQLQSFYSQLQNRKCLLIFDNVYDYKVVLDYLPIGLKTKVSILMTSNIRWLSGTLGEVTNIPVKNFTFNELKEFSKSIDEDFSYKCLDKETGRVPAILNPFCFGLAEWKKTHPDNDLYFEGFVKSIKPDHSRWTSPPYNKSMREIVQMQINLIGKQHKTKGGRVLQLLIILSYCNHIVNLNELTRLANGYDLFMESGGSSVWGESNASIENEISILIEEGFLQEYEYDVYGDNSLFIPSPYKMGIRGWLEFMRLEEHQLGKFIRAIENKSFDCLNIELMKELGLKYGEPKLQKMSYLTSESD